MTHAERQPSFACLVARYRAKQADGAPTLRYRKPVDRRSRVQQWRGAVAGTPKRVPALARRDATKHGGQRYGRGLDRDLRPRRVGTTSGGLAATELLHDVKLDQVVAEWTIDGRSLVIINKEIG